MQATVYSNIGKCYFSLGKNLEAITNFENSLYHVCDDVKVHLALTQVYKKMKNYQMIDSVLKDGCEQMRKKGKVKMVQALEERI